MPGCLDIPFRLLLHVHLQGLVKFPVLQRRKTRGGMEESGEILGIRKPAVIGNLADGVDGGQQDALRLIDPKLIHV